MAFGLRRAKVLGYLPVQLVSNLYNSCAWPKQYYSWKSKKYPHAQQTRHSKQQFTT